MTKTHVAGLGGVGFWLVPALLRAGHPVTAYDDDNLQGGHGHARLPQAAPETNKTDLEEGFCLGVMGDHGLTIVTKRFTGEEVETGDLFVDCTDMPLPDRKKVWDKAKKRGARCLRVSYDGRNNTAVVVEGVPLRGRPEGGYVDMPDLALSIFAGGVGAKAVQKILEGWEHHIDFQISLDTYFVNWDEVLLQPKEAVNEAANS